MNGFRERGEASDSAGDAPGIVRSSDVPGNREGQAGLLHYVVAVVLSGVCVLPWLLGGRQTVTACLLLLMAATLMSTWYGGLGPGLTAAALAMVATLSLFLPPHAQPTAYGMPAMEVVLLLLIVTYVSRLRGRMLSVQARLRHQVAFTNAMKHDPGEGICTTDLQGHLTFVNVAAQRMLGWSEAELIGKPVHEVFHGCGANEDECIPVCPFKQQPDPTLAVQMRDSTFLREDGEKLPVAYAVSPLQTENTVTGTVITFRDMSEYQEALEALQESQAHYRSLVDTSPDSILVVDIYGYVTMANGQAAELHAYGQPADLEGKSVLELIAPEDRERLAQDKRKIVNGATVKNAEYTGLRRDGGTVSIEVSFSLLVDDEQKPRALIHVARDISARKVAAEALRVTETRVAIQQAVTNILAESPALTDAVIPVLETICRNDGWDLGTFWIVEKEDGTLRCHGVWGVTPLLEDGFAEVTRTLALRPGTDLPGEAWKTRRPIWIADLVAHPRFSRALVAAKEGLRSAVCIPILVGTGVHAVVELYSRDTRECDADRLRILRTVGTQIGQFVERKHTEKALEHQALHDALTDLPNRSLMHTRLQRSVSIARDSGGTFALLLMDLNHFKEVNDTFGHHYGDALLREVAMRLQRTLRESDTVARLGGDEFAALLPAMDASGAAHMSNRILQTIAQPVIVDEQTLDVGTSIGIAMYPEHGEDAETLMQHADIAMYVAKRSRCGYTVYCHDQNEHSPARLSLMTDLRRTIERDQLMLHYQPKVDLKTGKVESVEALVRWHHPDRGPISPGEFIPLAEQTGLIDAITRWVLGAALRQCKSWHEEGLDLRVAVNLSAQSLHDPKIADAILDLLAIHTVDPQHLEIEITESAVMSDSPQSLASLTRLHSLGVRISIDDFGTGYSSLARLKRLPVDELKIDKSFVLEMAGNEEDAFIARSVIDLGHNLGLDVVAEGVEDEKVWNLLDTLGCDVAQGFYLSYPRPAHELTGWLHEAGKRSGASNHKEPVDFLSRLDRAGA